MEVSNATTSRNTSHDRTKRCDVRQQTDLLVGPAEHAAAQVVHFDVVRLQVVPGLHCLCAHAAPELPLARQHLVVEVLGEGDAGGLVEDGEALGQVLSIHKGLEGLVLHRRDDHFVLFAAFGAADIPCHRPHAHHADAAAVAVVARADGIRPGLAVDCAPTDCAVVAVEVFVLLVHLRLRVQHLHKLFLGIFFGVLFDHWLHIVGPLQGDGSVGDDGVADAPGQVHLGLRAPVDDFEGRRGGLLHVQADLGPAAFHDLVDDDPPSADQDACTVARTLAEDRDSRTH